MLLLPLAAVWLAQASPSPELVLLGRAKVKMAAALRGMPNYTCLQTIERSKRLAKRRKFELIDVLRLEVGLVDGRELFAWPGSGKFEDKELVDLVPAGGAIGNGAFAAHASSVFQGRSASIQFDGWEETPNRRARYAYRVPQNLSGYKIRNGKNLEAIVGYHGRFWVNPQDDRVMRIEVEADDVPLFLDVKNTGSSIDYSLVRIGDADYWLPTASSMTITDLQSSEFRNETTFSGCRQFAGESSLRFDDPDPAPVKEVAKPETVAIPKGIYFQLQIESRLKWGAVVTGEPIRATLTAPLKSKGKVLFPKGSIVEGRVVALQAYQMGQTMELAFETIVDGLRSSPFHAEPVDISQTEIVRRAVPGARQRILEKIPGRTGAIRVLTVGGQTDLPKGFTLRWATVE